MDAQTANKLGFKVFDIIFARMTNNRDKLISLGWDGIEDLQEFTDRHKALADQAHRMFLIL